jgi:hypothetical protein
VGEVSVRISASLALGMMDCEFLQSIKL